MKFLLLSAVFALPLAVVHAHNPGDTDLGPIEELHRRDMAASKAFDVDALAALWTDDIVSLAPDQPPVIGKDANRAMLLKMREQSAAFEILEYKLSFQEIKITGDWAFEWGTFSGTMRPRAGGAAIQSGGKLFRVLRRQRDGSWRVARTMWNSDAPQGK